MNLKQELLILAQKANRAGKMKCGEYESIIKIIPYMSLTATKKKIFQLNIILK